MESLEDEMLHALNALLEDQRANVEILVELTNGATETAERASCEAMGAEAVLVACALREHLATLGISVTRRINGIVLYILETERYDDRLRAFARHQADVSARAQSALEAIEERELRSVLRDVYDSSVRGALWCAQRAQVFADSRLLEFRANAPGLAKPPVSDEAGVETHTDASLRGEPGSPGHADEHMPGDELGSTEREAEPDFPPGPDRRDDSGPGRR